MSNRLVHKTNNEFSFSHSTNCMIPKTPNNRLTQIKQLIELMIPKTLESVSDIQYKELMAVSIKTKKPSSWLEIQISQ